MMMLIDHLLGSECNQTFPGDDERMPIGIVVVVGVAVAVVEFITISTGTIEINNDRFN